MALSYSSGYNPDEYQNNGGQWRSRGMAGTNAPKTKQEYWRYSPAQTTIKQTAPVGTRNANQRQMSPEYNAPLPPEDIRLNLTEEQAADSGVGGGVYVPPAAAAPAKTPAQLANEAEIERLLGIAGGKGLTSQEQAQKDYQNAVRNMASSQASVIGLAPGALQSNIGTGLERAAIQQDLLYQTAAQEERQKALDDAFALLMQQYGAEMADKERKTREEQLAWLEKMQPQLTENYRSIADLKGKTPDINYGELAAGSLLGGLGAALPYYKSKPADTTAAVPKV